jgi:hypothetical protein
MNIIASILFSTVVVISILYLFIIYLQWSICYKAEHRLDFLIKPPVVLPWYSVLVAPTILTDGMAQMNYLLNYYSAYYNMPSLPNYLSVTSYKCCPTKPNYNDPPCYNWWPQRIYS